MFPIWKLVGRHKIGLGEGVSSGYLLKLHRRTLYLWFCALQVNTDKLGLCIINYSVTPKFVFGWNTETILPALYALTVQTEKNNN